MPRCALIVLAAACAATTATADPLTTCGCADNLSEQWNLPSPGASSAISSKSNSSQCWQLTKTSGSTTCDGLCVVLGPCDTPGTPTWSIDASTQRITVSSPPAQAGWCLDENTGALYLQAYPQCIQGDTHQLWSVDASGRVHELWTGQSLCVGQPGPDTCPPPPASDFCYAYHSIHSPGLYDPSGPLLAPDGRWHVWEDEGGWSHYVSTDLLHWQAVGPSSTGFDGLTGSIAVTPAGIVAFWPSGDQSGIMMASSTDPVNLTTWSTPAKVITAPAMAGANFRDPLRAFQWQGSWYVGVGCNNASQSADLCLYQASDASLTSFTFVGVGFSTNTTFGQMDSNIVWQNTSVQATMMECPDLFPLGNTGKWMLMGSLFSTNQWWVGTLAGTPPVFTPDVAPTAGLPVPTTTAPATDGQQGQAVGMVDWGNGYATDGQQGQAVGMVDWGNGYAAKTGSTYAAAGGDRRLLFAFTGWNEPTADSYCGRAFILPRDLILGSDGSSPRIHPIQEVQRLIKPGTETRAVVGGSAAGPVSAPLTGGAQLLLSMVCSLPTPIPTTGSVYARVLGGTSTTGAEQYTEVGFDFSAGPGGALYVDHSFCCAASNTIVQRAYLPAGALLSSSSSGSSDSGASGGAPLLNVTVLLDGGLVESFANGYVTLTAMVNPDPTAGPAANRTTVFTNGSGGAGVQCTAIAWQLSGVQVPARLGGRGRDSSEERQ